MSDYAQCKINGKYMSHVFPGGYPVFYLTWDGVVLCAQCADAEEKAIGDAIEQWWINYGDDSLYCESCNTRIESAYRED